MAPFDPYVPCRCYQGVTFAIVIVQPQYEPHEVDQNMMYFNVMNALLLYRID